MSANVNDVHHSNNEEIPMSYSINIEALTTSKQPLTCCITTDRSRTVNQLNDIKSFTHLNKIENCRIKSKENSRQSSIHLPVTYSSTIYIPRHSSSIKPRLSMILPSQSSHDHYHYYYHHHHHHHHQRSSTIMKQKILPQDASNNFNEPTTIPSMTQTSPELLSVPHNSNQNIHLSLPISTSDHHSTQSCHHSPPPPLLPTYRALVWNWLHHIPTKSSSNHKEGQSDYSEVHRHDSPSKRSLLLKFFTSPVEKPLKSKHLKSSTSLRNKRVNYNE